MVLETLEEISKKMEGQDNRATSHPIYIVQQRRRIYGLDTRWVDDQVWLLDGEEVSEDHPDLPKVKEQYAWNGTCPDAWDLTGYQDIWEFVQPFFSEKGAQEYIEANKHNLTDPRIYVDSAYRNKEWQAIREVFLRLQRRK